MADQKISKGVQQFGRALEAGFMYNQLIHQTISIYKSRITAIANGKFKPPRHPKTLLREAFETSKSRLSFDGKFLQDDLLPTEKGIESSLKMIGRDLDRSPLVKKAFLAPFIYGVALGEYRDPSFDAAVAKQQEPVGSKNVKAHKCPYSRKELETQLKTLRAAMKKEFTCDTAYGTCNKNSMASGHCMLSALIVQDLFGGKILGGLQDGIPHYWNRICHYEVDLTGDQFNYPPLQIKRGSLYPDSYEFNRDPFESMNQDFNKDVWKKHCKFRKGVRKQLNKTDPQLAERLKKASAKLRK